jgi:hypothetical protein
VTCSNEAAPAIGKNVPVFYGLNKATTPLAFTPLRSLFEKQSLNAAAREFFVSITEK